jgi:hypothetical protein
LADYFRSSPGTDIAKGGRHVSKVPDADISLLKKPTSELVASYVRTGICHANPHEITDFSREYSAIAEIDLNNVGHIVRFPVLDIHLDNVAALSRHCEDVP